MGKSYGWAVVNEQNEIQFNSGYTSQGPRQLMIFLTKREAELHCDKFYEKTKVIKVYFRDSAVIPGFPIFTI